MSTNLTVSDYLKHANLQMAAEAFMVHPIERLVHQQVPLHGDVHGTGCSAASAPSAVGQARGSDKSRRIEE
jgi:hypothetical protein